MILRSYLCLGFFRLTWRAKVFSLLYKNSHLRAFGSLALASAPINIRFSKKLKIKQVQKIRIQIFPFLHGGPHYFIPKLMVKPTQTKSQGFFFMNSIFKRRFFRRSGFFPGFGFPSIRLASGHHRKSIDTKKIQISRMLVQIWIRNSGSPTIKL